MEEVEKRAGFIIIGNEILSGRTVESNLQYLASKLVEKGIELREASVVGDNFTDISQALSRLESYDYIFTSGGIGPTHDDITIESIARHYGCKVEVNREANRLLGSYYEERGEEFTESRRKMTLMPEGGEPIRNELTIAPGCRLGKIYILAGVPSIFRVMIDTVMTGIKCGVVKHSMSIRIMVGESKIAKMLGNLECKYREVEIGSYPEFREGGMRVEVVLRSRNEVRLRESVEELEYLIGEAGYEYSRVV